MRLNITVVLFFLTVTLTVQASPLTATATVVSQNDGTFLYTYNIVNTNADGTYVPGQTWGWLVIGDYAIFPDNPSDPHYGLGEFPADPSNPFEPDLELVSGPAGTYISSTGGFHNGPTLGPVLALYALDVGQSLTFQAVSHSLVTSQDYSTLEGTGQPAEFDPITVTVENPQVPEPSTPILLIIGFAGLAFVRRPLV